jgi:lipoate-protein ligase A
MRGFRMIIQYVTALYVTASENNMDRTKLLITDNTNPWRNIATETYLTDTVTDGEVIFYLWQNYRTVVIGRNQNAFKECKVEELQHDGGYLARRLSGGGSVYHDLGNLNFTFIAKEADYDVNRQLSVIASALKNFGLDAAQSGRNDLTIGGDRKFSGNAFYKTHGRCCHHGTILVDVDMPNLSRYLNVSAEKLRAHSVASVKSRVVNLKELNAAINIPDLIEALTGAFTETYAKPQILTEAALDQLRVNELTAKYSSDEWRFGKNMKADFRNAKRFLWGEIEIALNIAGDIVEDVQVFTDALDEKLGHHVSERLKGLRFHSETLTEALRSSVEMAPEILDDIISLLEEISEIA